MDALQRAILIEKFFSETGATYDQVVDRFTLGIDRLWKKTMLLKISALRDTPPARVLDLACGTGILTLALAHAYPTSQIVGVDISESYLAVARQKTRVLGLDNVQFWKGRAEDFSSEHRFDLVTASYLPKYADIPLLLRTIVQNLLPGGLILFHDFTYPTSPLLRAVFALYFKLIQPIGGRWYPAWREVLMALPRVIQETHWVSETVEEMRRMALCDIQVQSLTLQGAALVSAKKAADHGHVATAV